MDAGARLTTEPIRVFVLDDHPSVREALSDYLGSDPEMTVVGSAGTAEEALAGIAATRPTVAVLDARLGEGSGMAVCREARARYPEVRCVLLTSHSEQDALVAARLAGASGYLIKELGGTRLLDGIRTVARGGSLLADDPAESLQPLVEDLCERRAVRLSAQQNSVLVGALSGASNAQIADATQQSSSEVQRDLDTIFAGLGIGGRSR